MKIPREENVSIRTATTALAVLALVVQGLGAVPGAAAVPVCDPADPHGCVEAVCDDVHLVVCSLLSQPCQLPLVCEPFPQPGQVLDGLCAQLDTDANGDCAPPLPDPSDCLPSQPVPLGAPSTQGSTSPGDPAAPQDAGFSWLEVPAGTMPAAVGESIGQQPAPPSPVSALPAVDCSPVRRTLEDALGELSGLVEEAASVAAHCVTDVAGPIVFEEDPDGSGDIAGTGLDCSWALALLDQVVQMVVEAAIQAVAELVHCVGLNTEDPPEGDADHDVAGFDCRETRDQVVALVDALVATADDAIGSLLAVVAPCLDHFGFGTVVGATDEDPAVAPPAACEDTGGSGCPGIPPALCVTYQYNGRYQNATLGAPAVFTAGAGSTTVDAVLWFSGVPLIAAESNPCSPGGLDWYLLGLAGDFVVIPNPTRAVAHDASFGLVGATGGVRLATGAAFLLSIEAQMKQPIPPPIVPTANIPPGVGCGLVDAPADGDFVGRVTLLSPTNLGGSAVYGSFGQLGVSIGRQAAGTDVFWSLALDYRLDAAVTDPITQTTVGRGVSATADWRSLLPAVTELQVGSFQATIDRMPSSVTGATFGIVPHEPHRFYGVQWPATQAVSSIAAALDGTELLRATNPPTAFSLAVDVQDRKVPPAQGNPALESLERTAEEATDWQYVSATLRGTRTDLSARFDLQTKLGDVTVALTDVNDNLDVRFGREATGSAAADQVLDVVTDAGPEGLEADAESVIPAFTLLVEDGTRARSELTSAIIGQALITMPDKFAVTVRDLWYASLDTRQESNTGQNGHANEVRFGSSGSVNAVFAAADSIVLSLQSPSQTLQANLAVTQESGNLQSLSMDIQSTGWFGLEATRNGQTLFKVEDLSSGTLDFSNGAGAGSMNFGNAGYLFFSSDALKLAGPEIVEEGGCPGGGGSQDFNLEVLKAQVLHLSFGCDTVDADWLLQWGGRIDAQTSVGTFIVNPVQVTHTHCDFKCENPVTHSHPMDHVSVPFMWFCDSFDVDLHRTGDHANRCLGHVMFETIGPDAASGALRETESNIEKVAGPLP